MVEIGAKSEKGQGGSYRQKIFRTGAKIACAVCNNGWMSHLESECKASLLKIFGRQPTYLDVEDLRKISKWSIKTAIVSSYTRTEHRGRLPLRTSNAFYATRDAPPHAMVYLGSYFDNGMQGFSLSKSFPRFLEIVNAGESGLDIYDWTASIFGATLKVILFPPQLWSHSLVLEFPERRPLAPIWPPSHSGLEWPILPPHLESDLILSSFAIMSGSIRLTD